MHIYNRDGMHESSDPFALYPFLKVDDDASHAFYLGVELARAQIAWQLKKRYVQDQELAWGLNTKPPKQTNKSAHREASIKERNEVGKKV
jgi:hypothetical protein